MRLLQNSFIKRIFSQDELKKGLVDGIILHGRIEIMKEEEKRKKYFFIKYNYRDNEFDDRPLVGMFDDFNDIEEEMIEIVMDHDKKMKIYFCHNVKKINQDDNKSVVAGAFLPPKEFFKDNLTKEYKEFCNKYKLLLT